MATKHRLTLKDGRSVRSLHIRVEAAAVAAATAGAGAEVSCHHYHAENTWPLLLREGNLYSYSMLQQYFHYFRHRAELSKDMTEIRI